MVKTLIELAIDKIIEEKDLDNFSILTSKDLIKEDFKHHGDTRLLPTQSNLNPQKAHKNEFHEPDSEGTYQVMKNREKGNEIIVNGSGKPGGYSNIGDRHTVRHDQTGRHMGEYEVTHKVSNKEVHTLPHKKALPLYVYK